MSTDYAAEALANLSPAMRMSNGRSTRTDGLSGCELAGTLAGISEAGQALIAAKYIDGASTGVQSKGFYRLFMHVAVDLAAQKGWDTSDRPGILRAMTVVALLEVLNPMICRSCRGAKFVDTRPCQQCNASGHKQMSDREKARLCDVPRSTWSDTWAARYEAIYRRISGIESSALRKVASQMREG